MENMKVSQKIKNGTTIRSLGYILLNTLGYIAYDRASFHFKAE